ncbi:hypothetical protein L7F22_013458 [Adiantum nelumboides]|nr:hypothetical protein [Adiantum nelumboides]
MQLDGHSYSMFTDGNYHRLPYLHSTPMDIDPSSYGGSVYSSEGSNHLTAASTARLIPDQIEGTTAENSVVQNSAPPPTTGEDALSIALMDARYPIAGLPRYEEWTLDLRRLHMGPAFAQGAFGRLYRGTYNGKKLLLSFLIGQRIILRGDSFWKSSLRRKCPCLLLFDMRMSCALLVLAGNLWSGALPLNMRKGVL